LSDIIKVGMRSSWILLRMTMSRCFCNFKAVQSRCESTVLSY